MTMPPLPPLPARWYCVSNDGRATLCTCERDALENAARRDALENAASQNVDLPRSAPHRAVMMGDVAAERERCAAICDVRSADHWHDYKDRASPHRGDGRAEAASDEAEECAKAIRGHNVELSGKPRDDHKQ